MRSSPQLKPMPLPAKDLMTGYLPVVRWMLILRPAVVTSTLGVALLILPPGFIDKYPIGVVVFGSYLLTFLYWLTQRFSGVSRSLLASQITFDIFIITIIIHYTGGYDSSFVGFYFLSIMCASLFFRRMVTFLFSLLAVAVYVSYLIAAGYAFGDSLSNSAIRQGVYLQAFLYSVLMIAVALFSSYYSERMIRKDTALSSALRLLRDARLDTSDILQSMNNGLIAFDMSGRIMYLNRAAMDILRIERVNGGRYDELLLDRASELVEIIHRELNEKSAGTDEEIEIIDRSGAPVPIGLTTVPLHDTDGSRRGLIVNFKDLTEKRKLIEMLRQSDRMAAVGELSAAIAHEIRNPLASICNASELLADETVDRNEPVSRLVGIIERESERLQRITTEFLNFTRLKSPETQQIRLKTFVEEVLLLIKNDPRASNGVIIRSDIPGDPVIRFDPDHLQQLLINVLINSLDALQGNGKIEIGLERMLVPADRYVRMVISDTGPGFPGESIGSVFEPFFSTKKGGTGLGLALVRKMVIANHGRVYAINQAGGGAQIALDIPLNGAENVEEDSGC